MNKMVMALMIGSFALTAVGQSLALIACWMTLSAAAPVAAPHEQQQLANDSAKPAATPPAAAVAEPDDAEAAFHRGEAHLRGKGAPLDLSKAKEWLGRAARLGHAGAQATLGLVLFKEGDEAIARQWLKRAADAGEPRALLFVGTSLYAGDGVNKDEVRAYALVSRAAAQGFAPAKATLADMNSAMPLEQRKKGTAMALEMTTKKNPRSNNLWDFGRREHNNTPSDGAKQAVGATQVAAPAAASETNAVEAARPAKAGSPAGRWRVQLGAFKQRTAADALFGKLSAKLPGKQAYMIPVGPLVRLQAGPFDSRASASAACSKLLPNPCFPVAAK